MSTESTTGMNVPRHSRLSLPSEKEALRYTRRKSLPTSNLSAKSRDAVS